MSDWIARQHNALQDELQEAEQRQAALAREEEARRRAKWEAEAPLRRQAQAIADEMSSDAMHLLLDRRVKPKELSVNLRVNFPPEAGNPQQPDRLRFGHGWLMKESGHETGEGDASHGLVLDWQGRLRLISSSSTIRFNYPLISPTRLAYANKPSLERGNRVTLPTRMGNCYYTTPAIDDVFPEAVWYQDFDKNPGYVDSISKVARSMPYSGQRKSIHCGDCSPGMPLLWGAPDIHPALLARILFLGLKNYKVV
jgi:hypothetical protein